jgi:hypothetical protein
VSRDQYPMNRSGEPERSNKEGSEVLRDKYGNRIGKNQKANLPWAAEIC